MNALAGPAPIDDSDGLDGFTSGVASLDDWLRKRARANQASGASRTFVIRDGDRVVGYYALSSGAVASASTFGRIRRNMPDPIPVVVLGRLAIDRDYQGRGLGRALMRDAILRVAQAAEIIGVRAILVNALSEEAKALYLALGFEPSPLDPMTLMISLADARSLLS